MRKKRLGLLVLSLALALALAVTALAAGGEEDPLVTLSYLSQTVMPQILKDVETQTAKRQEELAQEFTAQIDQYKEDTSALNNGGSANYTLVTLTSGQTMALEVGCELLLRVGSATVNAATSPALIDTTDGGTINSGTALTQNHLYMATIPDRTLTPAADTVKLLVRGGYTVQ